MKMIYQPYDLTFETSPVYDTNLVSEVNEEMVIDLAELKTGNEVTNDTFDDTVTHLEYLSNTQQDDLLRKFILQERTSVPEARCSECSNKSCKNCQVMRNYKSYSAYLAYQCSRI